MVLLPPPPPLILFIFSLLTSLSSSLTDSESLLRFKTSVTVTKGDLNSWKPGSSPCKDRWFGIYCNDEALVSGLHLTNLGLHGDMDLEAIALLPALRTVRLDNNSFTGPLQPFNKLPSLRSLLLSNNSFSGEIPNDYFASMRSLRRLFLTSNKLTGNIPDSLMQLPLMEEIHIGGNQFTGKIPMPTKDGVQLKNLDFSNNNLEGEIPASLARFDPKFFSGNQLLCGKPLETACKEEARGGGFTKFWTLVCILVVMFFLFVAYSSKKRRDVNQFSVLGKEHLNDEVMEVHVPESVKKPSSEGSKKKGSQKSVGEMIMVNQDKGVFGLPDLMKAAAEVLGNGNVGSAYKAVMANGLAVVVKRIREMNKFGREGFDTEMRRLGNLRHPNVLPPLAYHYRREEKLVVSEYMPKSSLLYVLHGDRGIFHSELTWPTRLKILQGVAQGMKYIHSEFESYELPHGNLKSSNILLNDQYEPTLSDYAFQPLIDPGIASQALFAYKSPEYIQFEQVSHKSDVYCLGIVILEIVTGKFPSQYVSNQKGGTDIVELVQTMIADGKQDELIDPEMSGNKDASRQMLEFIRIGAACIVSDPDERISMSDAIRKIEQVRS